MDGRKTCKEMKKVREKIAKEYGITGFEYKECDFKGECEGHCPACGEETLRLRELIKDKERINKINNKKIGQEIITMGLVEHPEIEEEDDKDIEILHRKVHQPNEPIIMGEVAVDWNMNDIADNFEYAIPDSAENKKNYKDKKSKPRGLRCLLNNKKPK